jgi:hypothetical protein
VILFVHLSVFPFLAFRAGSFAGMAARKGRTAHYWTEESASTNVNMTWLPDLMVASRYNAVNNLGASDRGWILGTPANCRGYDVGAMRT